MINSIKYITLVFFSLMLINCSQSAQEYRPQVMGFQSAQYEQDLAVCKKLAHEKNYSEEVRKKTLAGAAIGTLAGGLGDGLEGALIGAVGGAGITNFAQKQKIEESRKREIVGCMKAKGHQLSDT